ncbi:MAG: hypothetical protein QF741_02705 [Candidatus Peribacteraceae bacterium]|jgi:hypothetical protein|nr:hypothetical protein [Candidatus Peribacteraceae bacterium]MDP7454554.1 hypothetical protein [Candidatus Peribacteraceae bacterium]MDP7646397.1 hypothetical protein [Candidatus Peribacteraceae bacterium]|tara:strand:- start:660 stop:839 length:180 start_codon:yes stop_codon:yes gene_type:complete
MGPESKEPAAEQLAHALEIADCNPCPAATEAVQKAAAPLIDSADALADFQTNPDSFVTE